MGRLLQLKQNKPERFTMLVTKQIFHTSATTLAAALLLGCICANGQDVPPPPKPKDDGPSLEVTMKFIQDKLAEVGRVNWVAYVHDSTNGNDWTEKMSTEASRIQASVESCAIT